MQKYVWSLHDFHEFLNFHIAKINHLFPNWFIINSLRYRFKGWHGRCQSKDVCSLECSHPVKFTPLASPVGCILLSVLHSMKICLNSRDLSPAQKSLVEEYVRENFSFEGRSPTLIWKPDNSNFMLLGYPHGNLAEFEVDSLGRNSQSIMFRIHESELMEIAGRRKWLNFREAKEAWSVAG